MKTVPQFGQHLDGISYIERPGAYVVLVSERGEVALIEARGKLHLPGGGIDPGESASQAARREVLEEIGVEVSLGPPLGQANQYVYSAVENRHFNKLCTYFLATAASQPSCGPRPEHETIWMPLSASRAKVDHESHAWAIEQAARVLASTGSR